MALDEVVNDGCKMAHSWSIKLERKQCHFE